MLEMNNRQAGEVGLARRGAARRGEGGILVGRGRRRHLRGKLGWAEVSIGRR